VLLYIDEASHFSNRFYGAHAQNQKGMAINMSLTGENKTPLDPKTIPKYKNQLSKPDVFAPAAYDGYRDKQITHYDVDISRFKQQILPFPLPKTTVFGYGGLVIDEESKKVVYRRSTPGPTFEVKCGERIKVKWLNRLRCPHPFAVDPTIHWANPNDMPIQPPKPWPLFPEGFEDAQYPVPTVTHVHGGMNPPEYDGHPDAWFTANKKYGKFYKTNNYLFENKQEATTLWYHDHALGITRLNVYAGLAGFYLIREKQGDKKTDYNLPEGKFEIPIVIQDRSFYTDGSLAFTNVGDNPEVHPYWSSKFFGDTITVNGKVWPNLNVEHCMYRFRLLNGSNARFYNFSFSNKMSFYQIGTDGGFLEQPVELYSLLLAPAERADIIVDFSCINEGEKLLLCSDASAPYPDGDMPDPQTVGQIMQFTCCGKEQCDKAPSLPICLNKIPNLKSDSPQRILTLNEASGENVSDGIFLNGQMWDAPVTEQPRVGSTEDWYFVNLTMDAHPIHLHLVQFEIISRRPFDADAYNIKWQEINGEMLPLENPTITLPFRHFVTGPSVLAEKNEHGWKDTVNIYPGKITKIRVRFAPQEVPVRRAKPGENLFSFNPYSEPGYVWHCHILDHEDNEMMRPLIIKE
jgi:spore coat protein A